MPSGSGGGPAALPGAGSAWGPSEGLKMMEKRCLACLPAVRSARAQGRLCGVKGTHPSPRLAQLCRCSPAAGSQVVAIQVGQLPAVQLSFPLCFSQFPVPAWCLSLALSPAFPAPSLPCCDLLIPFCLVPTVITDGMGEGQNLCLCLRWLVLHVGAFAVAERPLAAFWLCAIPYPLQTKSILWAQRCPLKSLRGGCYGAGAIKGDVDTAASSKPLVPSSHTWAGSIAWGQTVIPSAGHGDPPFALAGMEAVTLPALLRCRPCSLLHPAGAALLPTPWEAAPCPVLDQ